MKHLIAALLALAVAPALQAQDEAAPVNLQITVHFLQVDAAVATELHHGAKPAASTQEWSAVLGKLLKDKETVQLASLSVLTKSGQRATVESGREKVYATEYVAAAGRKEHSPPVPSTMTGVDVPMPSAFEMRPVGARMEVDPTLGTDRQTLDLNLAPEIVLDLGEDPVMRIPGDGDGKSVIATPRFYSMKTQTSVTVRDGGSALIGMMLPPNEDGGTDSEKRVLCFVTARIVRG